MTLPVGRPKKKKMKHVMRLAAGRPGRDNRGGLRHGGRRPFDPRKGIGIAGIHHERPGPRPAPEIGTATIPPAPRGISSGEYSLNTPCGLCLFAQTGKKSTSVRPAILDASLGGWRARCREPGGNLRVAGRSQR